MDSEQAKGEILVYQADDGRVRLSRWFGSWRPIQGRISTRATRRP